MVLRRRNPDATTSPEEQKDNERKLAQAEEDDMRAKDAWDTVDNCLVLILLSCV